MLVRVSVEGAAEALHFSLFLREGDGQKDCALRTLPGVGCIEVLVERMGPRAP